MAPFDIPPKLLTNEDMSMPDNIRTFREFWPHYLAEHSHPVCRRLHVIGTALALTILIASLTLGFWWGLLVAPTIGYLFAWIGHFGFEHNRPATFKYPFYSLVGDFVLFFKFVTGRL